jgi:hypothetical protein
VYAAGAVQGIVLVTAPAASTVFTSPAGYGLTSKASWTNNNLSADTTTWWVELTSTSGDTFIGTPEDTDNPCPTPAG